jgi:hypothetical protein
MPENRLDRSGLLQGQISVTPEEHQQDRAARLHKEGRAALIED